MLDEEKYILIERFFNNELSDAERVTFEQLLGSDIAFREEVKLQRSIIEGVEAHGKEELKKELAAIYLAAKPEINAKRYKPKSQQHFFSRLFKRFFFTVLAGALAWVVFENRAFISHKLGFSEGINREEINGSEEAAPGYSPANRDTVWHTIHVHGGIRRDTINVYSSQEAMDTLKTLSATRKAQKITIRRDTINVGAK